MVVVRLKSHTNWASERVGITPALCTVASTFAHRELSCWSAINRSTSWGVIDGYSVWLESPDALRKLSRLSKRSSMTNRSRNTSELALRTARPLRVSRSALYIVIAGQIATCLGSPVAVVIRWRRWLRPAALGMSMPAIAFILYNSNRRVSYVWAANGRERMTSMRDDDVRAALRRHWAASDVNDFDAEHANLPRRRSSRVSAVGRAHPRPAQHPGVAHRATESKRFTVRRMLGGGDLWSANSS